MFAGLVVDQNVAACDLHDSPLSCEVHHDQGVRYEVADCARLDLPAYRTPARRSGPAQPTIKTQTQKNAIRWRLCACILFEGLIPASDFADALLGYTDLGNKQCHLSI